MGFRSFVIHVANDLKLNQMELVQLPGKWEISFLQIRRMTSKTRWLTNPLIVQKSRARATPSDERLTNPRQW